MKPLHLLLIGFSICLSATAQKNNPEQEAIKKVIDQETRSFFEKKYDKWAETWAHDSSIFIVRASPSGYTQMVGWNSISENYKQTMQNFPVFTEDQIAPYMNKMNYHYSINGNIATVSFKEGKTEKEANDETRVFVKQNGAWKTLGMTVISSANYNLINSLATLKAFVGNWKLDSNSFKEEPASNGQTNQLATSYVRETGNGIEFVTNRSFTSNGQPYSIIETEQFIPDYNKNEIKYIDINKYSSGETYTQLGKAQMNANGNFTVTIMDDDKPTVKRGETEFALQKDGAIAVKNRWYDKDSKQLGANSFMLKRL